MSFGLVDEVLEHTPVDLTAAERLLLLCIANAAQESDRVLNGRPIPARTCFPGREKLKHWTGLNDRGLSDALLRLSKRGLEVRVPVAVDKSGRPVFAARGHATEFQLPVLKGHATAGPSHNQGHATAGPTGEIGHAKASLRSRDSGLKITPERAPKDKEPKVTIPPTPRQAELPVPASAHEQTQDGRGGAEALAQRLVVGHPGMAADDAREIVRKCLDDPETKMPASRLNQPGYVATLHTAVKADRAAERRRALANGARCVDHPESPAAHCPGCLGDLKCGQRDRRFLGRHQPRCSTCWEPIIGLPDGATLCGDPACKTGKGAA